MEELFRFVALIRGPVFDRTGLRNVDAHVAGLPHVGTDAPAQDRRKRAEAFVKSPAFVGPRDATLAALLRLAAEVRTREPLSRDRLDELALAHLSASVADLAADQRYRDFRARLYGSLRACRWRRPAPTPGYPALTVACRVVSLIDACADADPDAAHLLRSPWAQMITFGDENGRPALGATVGPPVTAAAAAPPVSDRQAELARELAGIEDRVAHLHAAAKQLMPQLVTRAARLDDEDRPPPAGRTGADGGRPRTFKEQRRALRVTWSTPEDVAAELSGLALRGAALRSEQRRLIRRPAHSGAMGAGSTATAMGSAAVGDAGAPQTVGTAKVLGEGLLLRVVDSIIGYEPGAIAKIVNIPATATKSVERSVAVRTEEVTETEESEARSTEQTVESDERFSLQSQTRQEIEIEMAAKAAGGFSGSYGPVSAEGSAEASTSFGMRSSTSSASDYAKGVTERAVQKVATARRELTRRSRAVEITELAKEGFDNTAGGHVTAVYRWVNEVHEGRLFNYGTRLMLEFTVPEPGAVLLWARQARDAAADVPQPPEPFDVELADIEPGGVDDLLERYGVTDVPAPPRPYHHMSKVFKVGDSIQDATDTRKNLMVADESLTIPDGYRVKRLWAVFSATRVRDRALDENNNDSMKDARFRVHIGRHAVPGHGGERYFAYYREHSGDTPIAPRTGILPVSMVGMEDRAAALHVIVGIEPTDELLFQWRLEVFAALRQAYDRLVGEYEDRLRQARLYGPPAPAGRNPELLRAAEREEIKRSVLEILTGQHFDAFRAIVRSGTKAPRVDAAENAAEGPYITFFETAVEWAQMEFVLYPYFWTDPAAWASALQLREDDTRHEEFLRASSARVTLPVRLGYEGAVLTYLSHPGEPVLWDGVDYTDIDMDSDLYFPVWRAILERQGQLETKPKPEGIPWRFSLPTDHQVISGGNLPAPPPLVSDEDG